jgi:hypothetical protein
MKPNQFTTFPRTAPPPDFIYKVVKLFTAYSETISTTHLEKGLTSDMVMGVLCKDLRALGFEVEGGKKKDQKIRRPVFYGEYGIPTLQYEIDAYHPQWRCGLEIEAGRAWMGNAVYRDLIQAMVMVNVDHLILAVPLTYKYQAKNKGVISKDYAYTIAVAESLYAHSRLKMPYALTVLGY